MAKNNATAFCQMALASVARPVHVCQMAKMLGNLLREARGETTLEALSEGVEISVSQLWRFESGDREPRFEEVLRIAKFLNVPPEQFISDKRGLLVPVVGRIAAGGTIDTEWEQQAEPLFEVEIPFPLSGDAVGFEIAGDSMWPKYDAGDVIVVSRAGEPVDSLFGQEAAVHVKDGGRFFKRILQTPTRGLFDLDSYNAPKMHGVEIDWASGLIARVPASRWRRLNGTAVKQAVRKARKN